MILRLFLDSLVPLELLALSVNMHEQGRYVCTRHSYILQGCKANKLF